MGTLSVKLEVGPTGRVLRAGFGSMTVKNPLGEVPEAFLRAVLKIYRALEFPRSKGKSLAVVPLIFS